MLRAHFSKFSMAAVTVSLFTVYREQLQDLSLGDIIVSAVQLNELQNQIKSQLYLNNNVGMRFLGK